MLIAEEALTYNLYPTRSRAVSLSMLASHPSVRFLTKVMNAKDGRLWECRRWKSNYLATMSRG